MHAEVRSAANRQVSGPLTAGRAHANRGPRTSCTNLAGCIVHSNLLVGAPEANVRDNGKPFRAILESGSAVSLVQSNILSPRMESTVFLPITCVDKYQLAE